MMQKARKRPIKIRENSGQTSQSGRGVVRILFEGGDVRTYVDRRLVMCGEVAAILPSI